MSFETAAEDLLAFLCWNAEKLTRPTFRNLTKSFEEWEFETRMRFHLRRLHRRQWLERGTDAQGVHYRLSDAGKTAVLGGFDPVARWERPWDGLWRIVMFDVAEKRHATRCKLLRWLRQHRFGFLQNSVWLRPDPIAEAFQTAMGLGGNASSLAVMEARCCLGYGNADIVAGAWNFPAINKLYDEYLTTWEKEFAQVSGGETRPADMLALLRGERLAWAHAARADPFLPKALLPVGYLGRQAWQARQRWLALGDTA